MHLEINLHIRLSNFVQILLTELCTKNIVFLTLTCLMYVSLCTYVIRCLVTKHIQFSVFFKILPLCIDWHHWNFIYCFNLSVNIEILQISYNSIMYKIFNISLCSVTLNVSTVKKYNFWNQFPKITCITRVVIFKYFLIIIIF